jgi:hypothetical protein
MKTWIWVLIPLAAIAAGVIRHWLSIKERQLNAVREESADTIAGYAAQTQRLEQRVRVLERIITDKGIEVADEIERLRDTPVGDVEDRR